MTYQAKNNAYSTLAGSLTNVATSLTVQTGHGDRFPIIASPAYTVITLEDASGNREVIKVTARAGAADTMTIVRAQEGTSARAWAAGDSVELRMTAAEVQTLFDHVDDTVGAHAASAIASTPTGNLAATTVQAALDELQTDVDTREKNIHAAGAKTTPVDADEMGLVDSAAGFILTKITWANIKAGLKTYFDTLYPAASSFTSHTGATTGAHAASAISYAGSTNLAATDVEAALDELDSEKQPLLTNATQAEMEAGTETALRAMSPNRVAQAIAALGTSTGALIDFTVFGAATVDLTSISNGTPAVLTVSAATLMPSNNSPVRLTTTGALPTGLSVATTYWVINASGTTFNLAATKGGSAIATSSAGSGTHAVTSAPYEKATNNPSFVIVEVLGGGGGGGGGANVATGNAAGGGGGGGGYALKKILSSLLASSETVTVGGGGTAGNTSGSSGGTGGTSSFGSFLSATGGVGGGGGLAAPNTKGAGGAAGVGSNGDLNIRGSQGRTAESSGISGSGGSSMLGGDSILILTIGNGTSALINSGSGASGAVSGVANARSGGTGGSGLVIVWEYA